MSGRTWPRDPRKRLGAERWCRTRPKSAPETNSKAISLGGGKKKILFLVFGHFLAELGPGTPVNGSGTKDGAERTQN